MEKMSVFIDLLWNRFLLNTVDLPLKVVNPAFWLELGSFVVNGIDYSVAGFIMSDFLLGLGLLFILFISVVFNKNIKNWVLFTSILYLASKWTGILYWVFFTSYSSFTVLNGVYIISLQSEVFKLIIAAIWLACLQLMSFSRASYYLLSYFIIAFGIIAVSSNNLLLLFLCLEGVSLSAYLLALSSQTFGGVSASAKYFIFGSLGSVFILWGIVNLYPMHPSLNVWDIYNAGSEFALAVEWPLSLILIGLLVKLGAAPFHIWLPDVYGGVSMFTIIIYSLLSKSIILFSLLNLIYASGFNYSHFMFIEGIAILSLVAGCYGAIRQFEIKKFIAYSSIVQLGFILSSSADVAFFYIIVYLISLYVFLFSIIDVKVNGKSLTYLSDFRFLKLLKVEIVLFTVSLFSLAGIPPFLGFYSKFLVWLSLIEDIYLFSDVVSIILLITNLLVSVIIIFYYTRLIIAAFTISLNETEKSYFVISKIFSTPLTLVVLNVAFLLIGGFIFNWSLVLIW